MTTSTAHADPRARPRSRLRRFVRAAGIVAIVIVLVPIVLVPVYSVVPPVSTLMAYERLFGPIERSWVPLGEVAPSLVSAAVMSEDGRFCEHAGVDWRELAKVVDRRGGPNRGASTITMQVVKNLFLWESRSYVRK